MQHNPPPNAPPPSPHPGSRATWGDRALGGGIGRIWDFAGQCPLVGRPFTEDDSAFLVYSEPRTRQQGSAAAGRDQAQLDAPLSTANQCL